jgi:predicted  nucleic acid-binding Zn-ribbon protein
MQRDFTPVHAHHDLLVELARVELAMERLAERDEHERETLEPRLTSRLERLRGELARMTG